MLPLPRDGGMLFRGWGWDGMKSFLPLLLKRRTVICEEAGIFSLLQGHLEEAAPMETWLHWRVR